MLKIKAGSLFLMALFVGLLTEWGPKVAGAEASLLAICGQCQTRRVIGQFLGCSLRP